MFSLLHEPSLIDHQNAILNAKIFGHADNCVTGGERLAPVAGHDFPEIDYRDLHRRFPL
jgi:hypothetical protein